jgi:nitrous oxidase accessory protein
MKLFAVIAVLFLFKTSVKGAILYVKVSGKINSIQFAVASAKSNDTIIVTPGTYREKNIVISKPLTLLGQNMPVLDGENKYEIISVKSDHVIIDGFHFLNSGYSDLNELGAVKNYNSRFVTVQNNFFENTVFAVYNLYATNCTIINNRFHSNSQDEIKSGNGIHCWRCDSMQVSGNTIEGHRDGIYFEFVTNSVIENNTSMHNLRYGLHFMFSHHNLYVKNQFSGNGAGVAVMFSNHVTMVDNIFSDNQGSASYGILMKEISDSRVEGNHFTGNTVGIYFEGTNRIEVIRNEFNGNGYAMRIQASCSDTRVNSCNFMGNTFDVATNGSLVLNSFNGNYWDKYEGYDLDQDGSGDVTFHPVSLYAMIIEQVPEAIMILHSFIVTLLDKMEKIIPSITPENLRDDKPLMNPVSI